MLTRVIKIQLAVFTILTVVTLVVLGWHYLRIPQLIGVGQYTLHADLPASGGLYATANVTYRGIPIGKITEVEPTRQGARATMSIDNRYKIPVDATANVHSVSAVGEQYLDLVSTGNPSQYLKNGQTITKSTVPAAIGPALDSVNRGLEALPREKIDTLLTETSAAVGGLGPALQRLVDSTIAIASDLRDNLTPVNDIITHSAPIIDSQVNSGDVIERWSADFNPSPPRPPNRTPHCAADCNRPRPPWIRSPRCFPACRTRCRRRWPISKSSSTCSSATTKASSRYWWHCRRQLPPARP